MKSSQKTRDGIQGSSPKSLPDNHSEIEDDFWKDIPPEELVAIKCTICGCVYRGFQNTNGSEIQFMLDNGTGMPITRYCLQNSCTCHYKTTGTPNTLIYKTEMI